MAPLTIALIGSGIFAASSHLPAILKSPEHVTLRAVYSRKVASCAKLCEGLQTKVDWYSDEVIQGDRKRGFAELLEDKSIDGVVICLPITQQEPYIRAALAAGKHVLSEKPIGPTVSGALDLLSWYHDPSSTSGDDSIPGARNATWSVGENWRQLDSHVFAASEIRKLGRLLGFRVRVGNMVEPGSKYHATEWRKNPEYQGGFLLDGGIHHIAATRLLLGPENDFARVSAFSAQLQEHLQPVDTVNATVLTRSNISGVFSVSFGTTFKGQVYEIACENGTVMVEQAKVTVIRKGQEMAYDLPKPTGFPDEGNGVLQEMRAWAMGISSGVQDPRLTPEEALQDLKALEAMLRSGEQGGAPVDIT